MGRGLTDPIPQPRGWKPPRMLNAVCRSIAIVGCCVVGACLFASRAQAFDAARLNASLTALESGANGRLGVAVVKPDARLHFAYRGGEAFPMCSTFKLVLVAAVLRQSEIDPGLLAKPLRYTEKTLLEYAPVTRQHLATGMTVGALCAATLQVSDNTAANLLLETLGGAPALNRFAASLGDRAFRLDRIEPDLNEAQPGDPRDTTTPMAMAASLEKLVLGDGLAPAQRELLAAWITGNTTGNASIRAGVPAGWSVGDKTGSGAYGTTNDIAVLWPPRGGPVVLAIYFTQFEKETKSRKDVLATATRLVLQELAGNERKAATPAGKRP